MDKNNKNSYGSEDILIEEQQLINEIQSILYKEYGYSPNQMKQNVSVGSDSQKMADLVVFNKNKSPIIIVEVKRSRTILPLSEYQLRELILDSKVDFGLLYNGTEKRAYQRVGNILIQINDIPKMGSTTYRSTRKFKPFPLPEEEIWKMAENVRGEFYDYNPILQVLALKILDEAEFKGKLFKSYFKNSFDKDELTKLLEIGSRHFPILFAPSRRLPDYNPKFFQLFDMIKNFSLQQSNIETITKAIIKFSMYNSHGWFDFPDELSSFMLELLSISKNKRILVPYAGLGYCFDITRDLRKKFKLTDQSFSRYTSNYFATTEINLRLAEILRIISLLRGEPFQIFVKDFLQLDKKDIENFEYVLSMPPIDANIRNQKEVNHTLGEHGRQLINYVLVKLLESQKCRAALLVNKGFLFQQNSSSKSILHFFYYGYYSHKCTPYSLDSLDDSMGYCLV